MFDQLRTWRGSLTTLGFALVLFLAAGSLAFPHGPDQALIAWVGSVILDGGTPYRDAWDVKGPLTYYIHAFSMLLFGRSEISIRVVDLAAVLTSCWLLRKLVLQTNQNDTFGANFAVILFGLIWYAGGFIDTAQPEGWGGMLILGAVVVLDSERPRTGLRMSMVGGLIAVATLIKPTFLIYLLLPCIPGRTATAHGARRLLPLGVCFLSFTLICVVALILLYQADALGDFLDVLRYLHTTYRYVGARPLSSALLDLPKVLFQFGLLIPYALVPFGLWRMKAQNPASSVSLLACWFALANLTLLAQGRYWQDHFLPAAIAASASAGIALPYLARKSTLEGSRQPYSFGLGLVVYLAALAPLGLRALSSNYQWPSYALGLENRSAYIKQVVGPGGADSRPYPYMNMTALAQLIEKISRPSDLIAIWGWDAAVFMMSERKSATRFSVFQPLIHDGPVKNKYREIFLAEIISRTPRLLIVNTRGTRFFEEGAGLRLLKEFPEFYFLLNRRYRLLMVLDEYQVWTLN